jgi:transcriptional regulator with XRE-family HTH domain
VIFQPRPRTRPLLRTVLGDVLRRIRLDQRRTLADVADAARVSLPYLSELERGRKEASSEILAALCDALGIELSELLAAVRRDLVPASDREAVVIRLESAASASPAGLGQAGIGPARAGQVGPAQPVRNPGDLVGLAA